jgi:hypothetical protein
MIQLDNLYKFVVDNAQFGDLSKEEVNHLFRDGRVASHFLEIQVTKWFPELERKEIKRGRAKSDHVDKDLNLYEMKSFTKSGCKLMPSYQYGGSRTFNATEFEELANETIYIISDIRSFPLVTITFRKGSDLVKLFPNGLISLKEEGKLYA